MKLISRVSRLTLVFCSFVSCLSTFAGTDGTPEGEHSRLQDEVTAARNALDAIALKPGVKRDDPRIKEKAAILDEKMKAYREGFQKSMMPSPRPTHYPNTVLNPPNGERDEKPNPSDSSTALGMPTTENKTPPPAVTPSEPETVLSSEGIQKEVTYPKKSNAARPSKTKDHAAEPLPESTVKADAAGLSEIQYPKKSGSPKK